MKLLHLEVRENFTVEFTVAPEGPGASEKLQDLFSELGCEVKLSTIQAVGYVTGEFSGSPAKVFKCVSGLLEIF